MAERMMELRLVTLGRDYGPLPMSKLVRLATAGRLAPHDMVRPVGTTAWLLLTEVPPLAAALPQATEAAEDLENALEPAGGWLSKQGRWQWGDVELDMTPMIDVTFQLLIFFMITHALANPLPMDVPEVRHGRGVTLEGQQLILVDQEGRYYLGDSPDEDKATASLDALVDEVRRNTRAANAQLDVIVSAHRKTAHGRVRELVERLGAVGELGRIMIGVEEKMD